MRNDHAHSERLSYRKAQGEDAEDLLAWYSDPIAMRYVAAEPLDETTGRLHVDTVIRVGQRTEEIGFWTVHARSDGRFVGLLKVVPFEGLERAVEIGFGLMPSEFGQGFATEMLRHLLESLPRPRNAKWLVGVVDPRNEASIRVLQKCGFGEVASLLSPETGRSFLLRKNG